MLCVVCGWVVQTGGADGSCGRVVAAGGGWRRMGEEAGRRRVAGHNVTICRAA